MAILRECDQVSDGAFKIATQGVFLEYQHIKLSIGELETHLQHRFDGAKVRVLYQDGSTHVCMTCEDSRFRSTDVAVFDYKGVHPTVFSVGKYQRPKMLAYFEGMMLSDSTGSSSSEAEPEAEPEEAQTLGDLLDDDIVDQVLKAMGPVTELPTTIGETMGDLPFVYINEARYDWGRDVLHRMWCGSRYKRTSNAIKAWDLSGIREINAVLNSPVDERASLIQHLSMQYSQQVYVISGLPTISYMRRLHSTQMTVWNRDILIIDYPCIGSDSNYYGKLESLCGYLNGAAPMPGVSCVIWLFISMYPLCILEPFGLGLTPWRVYTVSEADTAGRTASRLVVHGKQ